MDACCMRTKRGCLLQDDASCMIMILEREAEASFSCERRVNGKWELLDW